MRRCATPHPTSTPRCRIRAGATAGGCTGSPLAPVRTWSSISPVTSAAPRSLQRRASSDERIIAATDESVTFRYTDSATQQPGELTLTAEEFMRRYLQHVPPPGQHRVRYFGWMHPAAKKRRLIVETLLAVVIVVRPKVDAPEPSHLQCPCLPCSAQAGTLRHLHAGLCRQDSPQPADLRPMNPPSPSLRPPPPTARTDSDRSAGRSLALVTRKPIQRNTPWAIRWPPYRPWDKKQAEKLAPAPGSGQSSRR